MPGRPGCAHPGPLVDQPDQSLRVVELRLIIHGHETVNQVEAQPHNPGRTVQGGAKGLDLSRAVKSLHAQRAPRLAHRLDLVRSSMWVVDLAFGPMSCPRRRVSGSRDSPDEAALTREL